MNGQSLSTMEMGLSSMVSLLQAIATEQLKSNNFLESIATNIKETVDFAKDIFASTVSNKLDKYRRRKDLRDYRVARNIQTITSILMEQLHKPEETVKNAQNKNKGPSSYAINNIDKNVNLYINNKLDSKGLKQLDGFMTKIVDLLSFDKSKFDNVNGFFDRFNEQLDVLQKKGYKSGIALAFITASLIVLQYVSWVNIAKMAVVLVTVGIGFALFFKYIVKATADANFLKSVALMLFLPDVLIALGKAIIMFSVALFIFNYVGYEAIIKFSASLMIMALTWKYAFNKTKVSSFAFALVSVAVSVMVLSFALINFDKVNFGSVFKLLGFIVGLNYALKFANNSRSSFKFFNSPLKAIAFGLTVLIFSLILGGSINWGTALGVIGFIVALNIALNKFANGGKLKKGSPTSMIGFGIGLGIMVLALSAVGELNWSSILILSVWMLGFGIALRIATGGRGGKMSGVFGFALGLGILILALDAIGELNWSNIIKLSVWIIAISVALRIANGGRGKGGSVIMFAIGLGLIVLAMDAMSELSQDSMINVLLFIAGLGIAMRFFPEKIVWNIIILSASLFVLSYSIKTINNTSWDLVNILKFVGSVVLIGALFAGLGYGPVAGLVAIGSAVAIGLALSSYLISVSLNKISKLEITWGALWDFAKSILVISLTFALLSPFIVMAGFAAFAFLPVALSSLMIASVINKLSKVEITNEKITSFGYAILMISIGFAKLAPIIGIAAIMATLFLPVAISSLLAATLMNKISNISINTENAEAFSRCLSLIADAWKKLDGVAIVKAALKATALLPVLFASYLGIKILAKMSKSSVDDTKINNFSESVGKIIDMFNKYGVIESVKIGAKATSLLPVVLTAYLAAKALEKISNINLKSGAIDAFSNMLNYLTDRVLISLADNETKLAKAKPGIQALGSLLNVFKSLGDVIQLMSKMKFYEMGVNKDGKLVYKSVRELTEKDLQNFSSNIAKLIETLVTPLSILGSDADILVIGGRKIKNPFKNKQTLEGIEVIGKLGTAYKPLAESILTLMQSGIMGDAKKSQEFTNSLIGISATYLWFFGEAEKFNPKMITNVMDLIKSYNESINSLRVKHIKDLNDIFASFMTKFTDDMKWRKIERNLVSLKRHFKELSTIINSVNIQKADKFEKVVRALVDRQNGKGLVEAAEALRDILTQVNDSYVKQQEFMTKQLEVMEKTATTLQNTSTGTPTIGSGILMPGATQQSVQSVQPIQQVHSTPSAPSGYLMSAREEDLLALVKKILMTLNLGNI